MKRKIKQIKLLYCLNFTDYSFVKFLSLLQNIDFRKHFDDNL